MAQVGTGKYTYELIRDFCKLPAGQSFGLVSRVAADAQDRIYVFQRKDPPVVVFDREGKYLGAWGSSEVTDPHGLKIVGDVVYTTDRSDSVAKSFTLDGKPLLELGTRGVHSQFGRVDILINNAAIRPHMPFRELTDEDWEHVRNVVLDGALYLTRALIGSMVENKYGNILFFVGDGAYSGRGSGRAHLSAAKMALVGLARGLASEFAPHNIRVNVVSPGSIDTRRDNPEWYGNRPPDAAGIPLARQGKIDEIAATCLFLVSDGGGFITGQTIHVNGGAGYY